MHPVTAVLPFFLLFGYSSCIPPFDDEVPPRSQFRRLVDQLKLQRRQGDEDSEKAPPMYGSRQCNVTSSLREDCGFAGIRKKQCFKRGCCWKESDNEGVPWCFHSEPAMVTVCTDVQDSERLECGNYGIQSKQCLKKDCCWRPTDTPNTPWCYHKKVILPFNSKECGIPEIAPNVNYRIVGGVEAVPNSWPWMVSLQYGGRHFCGASLISEKWIVSAAHCAPRSASDIQAVLGMHNTATEEPEEFVLRVDFSKVIVHPEYQSSGGMDHDVMLLKLANPVEFNTGVRPVCIPTPSERVEAGKRCYTTGWGALSSGGGAPDVLQQVKVPVLDNEVCNQPDWYAGEIDDTMVCAGYTEGGRDSCQGDSGGPFVCYENEHWLLQGAVSWGHGCAFENKPGLYASISYVYDWIKDTIAENSDD